MSATYCDLAELDSTDLEKILRLYPKIRARLRAIALWSMVRRQFLLSRIIGMFWPSHHGALGLKADTGGAVRRSCFEMGFSRDGGNKYRRASAISARSLLATAPDVGLKSLHGTSSQYRSADLMMAQGEQLNRLAETVGNMTDSLARLERMIVSQAGQSAPGHNQGGAK